MTQTTTTPEARAKARIVTYPTRQLVEALAVADTITPNPTNSLVRHWLIEEVERRFPTAADAVGDAFYMAETSERADGEPAPEVNYVAVLIANIPSEALAA